MKWGRYRLEVSTGEANGPVTSLTFDAGFYADASANTPDLLDVATDKSDYKSGETIAVSVTARSAGRLTLNVFTDRLVESKSYDVQAGTVQQTLTVGNDWGTGAYLVATLRRPLDAPAQRMPGRAIGVKWFSIDRTARTLALDMTLPATLRPNSTLSVPVHIAGLKAGDEARIVVAAVDVGILNLTNYKPPAPDNYYLGQRQLTAEIRDLYGQLIDGMQGVRGQIRSGGDEGAQLTGSPPTQAPLSLYSGIVQVGADGNAQVSFAIPAFAGTVRVMAVAWSKDKVGKASGDVVVRDPVVLTATLPRFLRTGDHGQVQLELDNVEGAAGDYRLAIAADGAVKLDNAQPQTLNLAAKQRNRLSLPVSASGTGASTLKVSVSGPDGFALERSYALDVRPATQTLTRRTVRALSPGETFTLSKDMFADFVPGTGRVALSVSVSTSLDAAALLTALDRYPFRCSEQTTSRAIAMLYVNDLGRPSASCGATAISTARSATPSRGCCHGRHRTARSAFGRSAARTIGSTPMSPISSRARASGNSRCRRRRSSWRSTGCAISSRPRPMRARTAAAISLMRSTCWRATARRRSAICATSPTSSSAIWRRRSPRRRSAPRSPCWATRNAPSTCSAPRSMPSRRSPSSSSGATITARRCATRPRW